MSAAVLEGGCSCRAIRYRLTSRPLIVHCCHCRWCQRESGAAFALNALIEAHQVELLTGMPVSVDTPTHSGKGQRLWRCAACHLTLWSNYAGAGEKLHFVRVGTLDQPDQCPPDVHIFTGSQQPWISLPPAARSFTEYYRTADVWPADSLARRAAMLGR